MKKVFTLLFIIAVSTSSIFAQQKGPKDKNRMMQPGPMTHNYSANIEIFIKLGIDPVTVCGSSDQRAIGLWEMEEHIGRSLNQKDTLYPIGSSTQIYQVTKIKRDDNLACIKLIKTLPNTQLPPLMAV